MREQSRGGEVDCGFRRLRVAQFFVDRSGQDLAELDAGLIKRIDPPEDACAESPVLVERQEYAESTRRQGVQQEGRQGMPAANLATMCLAVGPGQ